MYGLLTLTCCASIVFGSCCVLGCSLSARSAAHRAFLLWQDWSRALYSECYRHTSTSSAGRGALDRDSSHSLLREHTGCIWVAFICKPALIRGNFTGHGSVCNANAEAKSYLVRFLNENAECLWRIRLYMWYFVLKVSCYCSTYLKIKNV